MQSQKATVSLLRDVSFTFLEVYNLGKLEFMIVCYVY